MNMKKIVLGLVASLGLAAAMAMPSQAQQTTFASITGAGTGSSTVFTYTSGPGGGFSITPGSSFEATYLLNPPSALFGQSVTFTGLQNVGTVTGAGTTASPYTQALSGGTFTIGPGLLTGTFSGGHLLDATSGAGTASLIDQLNNVTYTGGTYFTQSGLQNPGAFSISLTSVNPTISVTGGYINSFQAAGTGTFSATSPTSVPEPASVVPFALGGLALLGLIARKTRRTSGASA
jgi:hypothetical protein